MRGLFDDGVVAPWGVTRGKILFDPPAQTPGDLKLVRQEQADGTGLVRCFLQAEPARQMPHLRGIPILILVSEASYHAPYDHCTAKFLEQAGVKNSFVKLTDHGIRGNGHMMMLEKNNLEIAHFCAAGSKPTCSERLRPGLTPPAHRAIPPARGRQIGVLRPRCVSGRAAASQPWRRTSACLATTSSAR